MLLWDFREGKGFATPRGTRACVGQGVKVPSSVIGAVEEPFLTSTHKINSAASMAEA